MSVHIVIRTNEVKGIHQVKTGRDGKWSSEYADACIFGKAHAQQIADRNNAAEGCDTFAEVVSA